MPRLSRFAAYALLVVASRFALAAPAATNPPKPKETAKYGVYLNDARIGSMVTRLLDTTAAGKPALRMEADMEVKIAALGSAVEQKITSWHLLDPKGSPISSRMAMTSLGRETVISTRYEAKRVVCNVNAGGQKSTKVVPIPKGVTLSGDPQLSGAKDGALKVGAKTTLHFFEPMTMSIQKVQTEVLKQDKRTVGGKSVNAFLMKTTNSITGSSQTWVDAKGHMLEDTSKVGIRLVREDVQSLTALSYDPPKDFAIATSVKTAVKLPNARELRSLKVKIGGLPDEGVILSDVRQRVSARTKTGDSLSAVYDVRFRELPQVTLPLAAPGAQDPGLGDATYLGLDNPEIQKQGKALAEGAPDRAAVARRARAWVKAHMQKQNNVGTLRSASEIMKSQDGVCRDYATLFAAVARAAGLPTRICSGIVYFQDGFFYHAWNESQLTEGADGWYPFDSTLDTDFVDATHVKFAQGDPVEMFAAIRVIGQIKAEVLEFK
ncbi:MAG: transglutaminase-like domain-containing protein [Actinomycetota bacterium]